MSILGKGKACGKFILLGEHFVIPAADGSTPAVPALAFPIPDLWCEVRVEPNHHPHYSADIPDSADRDTVESLMAHATYAAASSLRLDIRSQPLKIRSSTNFAVSRGFGSSASFAVSLVRALDDYRRKFAGESASWDELVKATGAVEKLFHGRPSGVDTSVILAGRGVRFENGLVVREVVNRAVDFVIVDSGNRDHCAALVQEVGAFRDRNRAQWVGMAAALRSAVDECEAALSAADATGVARAVGTAHAILSELGLSSDDIERLLGEARGFGALAGKVSGAGGGGAVVLVARRFEGQALAGSLQQRGWKIVSVEAAERGSL